MPVARRQPAAPTLAIDLFGDASLRNPHRAYKAIRDAGPAVRLQRPDVYAVGRFADVQAALRAPDRLISGKGIGFNDLWNASGGASLIQSDGPVHSRMRNTVIRPLSPAKLREVRSSLKRLVVGRVDSLLDRGWFDAMESLASFLPVAAVSHLVGLPEEGRGRMLDWAAATFNLIGPDIDRKDAAVAEEARAFMTSLDPSSVRSGSWAGDLFAAVESGRLSRSEAMQAISAYVIPSLDTTILAKGHMLHNLASYPDQWDELKRNPDKIPAAVLENVRHSSPVRWFGRMALEDYDVDGVIVPKGARVMLLYGSANRDERHFPDPDRFDIDRDPRDQLAWGTGPHMCVGMHLAKLEMEVMLEALVEAHAELEAGTPTVGNNRGLHGYTGLPFRMKRPGGVVGDAPD